MKSTVIAFAAVAVLLCVCQVGQAELRVKITVTEPNGMSNKIVRVSNGVPFLAGQVTDLKTLRVVAANGKEMVAQFRPLARWWSKDNSLRWVQVDFKTSLGGFQSKDFYVTDGRTKAYESPLKVTKTDETLVVDTGVARFTIDRKNFNLFKQVRLDHNRDGEYAQSEEVISPGNCVGGVVVDTLGNKYLASKGTTKVDVEESGPVRVCIVAKGVHRPQDEGYSRGMYGYDVRMHFYANSSLVRLDTVMHNGLAKPNGEPTFEDYSLKLKLNLTAENQPMPEHEHVPPIIWGRVYGQAPVDYPLKEGESVKLYQDSLGADTWQRNSGLRGPGASTASTFRGYRIYRKSGGDEKIVTQGDQARGLIGVGGKNFGIAVFPRYFWQKFPKAVEVSFDGSVRIGILPGEYKKVHWIDDAAGCGQEMWLLFYSRGREGKKYIPKAEYSREYKTKADKHRGFMRNRPKLRSMAHLLTPQVVALAAPEHYGACGALADLGPYLPITGAKGFALKETEWRYMTTDYLKGNAFGWQVFGCRWEEAGGHTPFNHEPILSSDYLFQYIVSRDLSWLEFGYRRDMQYRDSRGYKIEGIDPFAPKTFGRFQRTAQQEGGWGERPQPKGLEVAKYTQGKFKRFAWELPDPAHSSLDEIYDLYCLFGDTRALEGMKNIAAVGGAYAGLPRMQRGELKPARTHVSRLCGWSMRSLVRYYDLTGDEACLNYLNLAMDSFWDFGRRHRQTKVIPCDRPGQSYEGWMYNILGRSIILTYMTTGDERMRDLALGMAQGRHNEILRYPSLNAFAYEQTGDDKHYFKEPQMFARYWAPQVTQIYSKNYFVSCDGYRWAKPRPDKDAPGAVKDLQAVGGAGNVKLTWTAPGDDGAKGTATVYQVKYDDLPIVEETSGGKIDVNFWAATNVSGEPEPKRAGTRQQMVVAGLTPGTYHFAIKTRDELNNESAISNVVTVMVR